MVMVMGRGQERVANVVVPLLPLLLAILMKRGGGRRKRTAVWRAVAEVASVVLISYHQIQGPGKEGQQ